MIAVATPLRGQHIKAKWSKLVTSMICSPRSLDDASATNGPETSHRSGFSRPLSVAVGILVGGLCTAIAALGLALVVWLSPVPSMFGSKQFSDLIFLFYPMLALPGGVLGGAVMGSLWKSRWSGPFALLAIAVLAIGSLLMGNYVDESGNPLTVLAISKFVAAAVGLKVVSRLLDSMHGRSLAIFSGCRDVGFLLRGLLILAAGGLSIISALVVLLEIGGDLG